MEQKIVNDTNMELVVGKILPITSYKYLRGDEIHACVFFKAGEYLVVPPGNFWSGEANHFVSHLDAPQHRFFSKRIITWWEFCLKYPCLGSNHLCSS